MTTFTHQTDSIQKYISSIRIIYILVESEPIRFKHEYK